MERKKLLLKQKNERDGYDAIIMHLKNKYLHDLEKMNKRVAKELQEKDAFHEKNQASLIREELV